MVQGWVVVEPPTSGAKASIMKKLESTMIGQQPQQGAIISEHKKLSTAMVGKVPYAGPIASVMKAPVSSMMGRHEIPGTMASTMKRLNMDAAMPGNSAGVMSSSMKKMVMDAAAQQILSGTMDSQLAKAIATLAGQQAQSGVIDSKLQKLVTAMQGLLPTPVQVSSVGAGAIDDTLRNNKTLTYQHTIVPGNAQRLIVTAASGHSVWVNPSDFAVSATVNGVPVANNWSVLVPEIDYGNDSGWRLGHITAIQYLNPPPGDWFITVTQSVGSQGIHRMIGNSIVYDNVGSVEQVVTQASTSSNAALNLSVTPQSGDMAVFGGGYNASPTITAPLVSPWYSGGSTRNGDLDYWDGRNVPGEGAAVGYTSSNTMKLGAFGFVLKKV